VAWGVKKEREPGPRILTPSFQWTFHFVSGAEAGT